MSRERIIYHATVAAAEQIFDVGWVTELASFID